MTNKQRYILLTFVILTIVLVVYVLDSKRAGQNGSFDTVEILPPSSGMDLQEKQKMFEPAKEITTPDGFINGEGTTIGEYIGEKVILIDFWTYSCINCQRTTPYLNAWYEKYKDRGLVIIGIHTPEFDFEKKLENVQNAVNDLGIQFPVVLDNDYSTWRAYQNRYWPRKYLIDIDGFIVYDHIGEGAYDETEEKIQELLRERAQRLQLDEGIEGGLVDVDGEKVSSVKSPEIYFGASRNAALENGVPYLPGLQQLILPESFDRNNLYLQGDWQITDEYAENTSTDARIVFPYEAANVFMVASSKEPLEIVIRRDGVSLDSAAGSSVFFSDGESKVLIQEEKLYRLIEDSAGSGQHTIEILIPKSGLQAFTFTFG